MTSGIFAQAASGTAAAEPRQRARVRRVDALPPAGLPLRWSHVRLKHVAKLRSGESITSEQIGSSDEYPVFGGNGLRGYTAAYTHEGDFPLIGRQGALCGCVNFASGRFWASEHAVVAAPLNGHHSTWLFYVLSSMNLGQYSQSAAQPGLSVDVISNLVVPVPPTEQQRAIADFLDRETEKTDALVAKKRRLIELLQEERTAVISDAITKGLDPDVPMKDAGVGRLGDLPRPWTASPLMRLVDPERPIMYGIVLPGPDFPGGVPIIKGGDVSPERLVLERLNRTDPEIEAKYVRSRLAGGDIVYAIRGSIGAAAVVPDALEGANLTQDTARVAPRTGVHVGWLMYALQASPIFAQLEAGAVGATIRGINIFSLKRADLPVPPQGEQVAIRQYLDLQTRRMDELVESVRGAIERLREYRSALITAAVTGQIDVRVGRYAQQANDKIPNQR